MQCFEIPNHHSAHAQLRSEIISAKFSFKIRSNLTGQLRLVPIREFQVALFLKYY